MKFDIGAYSGKCVMHCPTKECAEVFLKFLDSCGICWRGGSSYLDYDNWHRYTDRTCYYFTQGEYCNIDYFKQNGYTVLEFDDFEWGDSSELQPEMSFEEMFYGTHIKEGGRAY